MKVRTRKWRNKNTALGNQRQNRNNTEQQSEVMANKEGNCSTQEEKVVASSSQEVATTSREEEEVATTSREENAAVSFHEENVAEENAAEENAAEENAAEENAAEENAAPAHEPNNANYEDDNGIYDNEEPYQDNEAPDHENNAVAEIDHLIQGALANDDDDSGTENDRNVPEFGADDDPELHRGYQVDMEVARTMTDMLRTRDVLFTLTRRVNQLLDICRAAGLEVDFEGNWAIRHPNAPPNLVNPEALPTEPEVERAMNDIVHTKDTLSFLTSRLNQLMHLCQKMKKSKQPQKPDEQQKDPQPPNDGAGESSQ